MPTPKQMFPRSLDIIEAAIKEAKARPSNAYTYSVSGTAAGEQTWQIDGQVEGKPGDFPLVFEHAMRATFNGLTNGKAVFGKPGVGCSGPYRITRLVIEALPT